MIFELLKNGNPRFSSIHPMLAGVLRSTCEDPWERYPDGSMRLLPPPGEDQTLLEDWHDLVQPELRRQFESERTIVTADLLALKQSRGKQGLWSLEIPADHIDAWLITLNALRLALATEHQFCESDLAEKKQADFTTARGFALMQIDFFAFMQECLIKILDDDAESSEEE